MRNILGVLKDISLSRSDKDISLPCSSVVSKERTWCRMPNECIIISIRLTSIGTKSTCLEGLEGVRSNGMSFLLLALWWIDRVAECVDSLWPAWLPHLFAGRELQLVLAIDLCCTIFLCVELAEQKMTCSLIDYLETGFARKFFICSLSKVTIIFNNQLIRSA